MIHSLTLFCDFQLNKLKNKLKVGLELNKTHNQIKYLKNAIEYLNITEKSNISQLDLYNIYSFLYNVNLITYNEFLWQEIE